LIKDTGEGLSYRPFNEQGKSVSKNSSLHENYHDEEPTEAGSDRAFGWRLIPLSQVDQYVV
jgi:hypothetical protein